MEQILTDFISTWGYAAITILILLENILLLSLQKLY